MPPLGPEKPKLNRVPERPLSGPELELSNLRQQLEDETDSLFPYTRRGIFYARKLQTTKAVYPSEHPNRINRSWITRYQGRYITTYLTIESVSTINNEVKDTTKYDLSYGGVTADNGESYLERHYLGEGYVIEDRIQFAKDALDTIAAIKAAQPEAGIKQTAQI